MSTSPKLARFYVTTPIYYVNDRPHIGHVYTTTIADVMARHARLQGRETFFLTGTDEHATKVVEKAAENGMGTRDWADRNAGIFEETFKKLGMTHDDFIRTSQPRHKAKVTDYVQRLLDSGDAYLGDYEGWYDAGQEEYLPDAKAEEYQFKSPFNGKPLVRKKEKNYFFKLSKYQPQLLALLERGEAVNGSSFAVLPEARKNEIVGRIRDGLNDVPMSRSGMADWGIEIPGSAQNAETGPQTVYVWIDALFNYLSVVDTPERRTFWDDAEVLHLTAKDILWFHAAIWPALLLALGEKLPARLYAHSFWISEGKKMSKSLGNFIDLEKIDAYVNDFSLDALRWFLVTQGPMGTNDSDFSHDKFVEMYNAELANGLGNCFSRVSNMTEKYFGGKLPEPTESACAQVTPAAAKAVAEVKAAIFAVQPGVAAQAAIALIRAVDKLIEDTKPFSLAKDPANLPQVGTILYHCAEAVRIASVLLWPVIPAACEKIWARSGLAYGAQLQANGLGEFDAWTQWGGYQPGARIEKGEALFMRYVAPK